MTNFTKYIATIQTDLGLEAICFLTGEVRLFDNMKELITEFQKNPTHYRDFFSNTSKEIREEAGEYTDCLEVVKVRF